MSKTYNYILQPGQNLVDIAMQEYGSADALTALCVENGFEVGQEVEAGTELILNEENIIDSQLVSYFKNKKISVAGGDKLTVIENHWILGGGVWDDDKIWIDKEQWEDN